MKLRLMTILAAAFCASASVPEAPELGYLGGVAGQVLRINVMAVDPESPALVSVVFTDMLGRPVGPAPKLVKLLAGQAEEFELNFANVGRGRVYVRPALKYADGSGRAMWVAEYYDTYLGRVGASSHGGGGGAGRVAFGPIGLAQGQTMRLAIGAIIDPNFHCAATIGFRRSDGSVVDPNDRVNLLPGQWAYKELNFTRGLKSTTILPAVQMDPGATGCTANVQVFDASTGWTNVFVEGAINF